MLYPRVLIATAISIRLSYLRSSWYLAAPALVAAIVTAVGTRRSPSASTAEVTLLNPLQLTAALQMAVLFQVVLMAVYLAREWGGQSGVFTSAAVLGLTDVDALTVSMARGSQQTISPAVAATAIAVGVLANTGMKLGLAMFLGSRRFRSIAGGALLLMLLALGAALMSAASTL